MAQPAGVKCPRCGSAYVNVQPKRLDPKTGKPLSAPIVQVLLWGLIAIAGIAWLVMVAVLLVAPTPGVSVGGLDLIVTIVAVAAIGTAARMIIVALGAGGVPGLFCWCQSCQNEWTLGGPSPSNPAFAQPVTVSPGAFPQAAPAPPAASAPAPVALAPTPGAVTAVAPAAPLSPFTSSGDLNLRWVLQTLGQMRLPTGLRGWNQVIAVKIEDRPDLPCTWIIDGDRWVVSEGETSRATLRLTTTEKNLIERLTSGSGASGYELRWPSGLTIMPAATLKCLALMDSLAGYLRTEHATILGTWEAARIGKKKGVDATIPVNTLVEKLGSGDAEVRKAAADALATAGWTPPPGYEEAYWAAKWDWAKAWAAARLGGPQGAAGITGGPAISNECAEAQYLIGYLKHKDVKKSRAECASIVNALAGIGPASMPVVFDAFKSSGFDSSLQTNLHTAIQAIFRTPWPLEQRVELLRYRIWKVDGALKSDLAASGAAAVEPLINALRDSDPHVRRNAAEILGWIRDPRAAGPLMAMANDPDGGVRGAASLALQNLRT